MNAPVLNDMTLVTALRLVLTKARYTGKINPTSVDLKRLDANKYFFYTMWTF